MGSVRATNDVEVEVAVRRLDAADAEAYRALRLRALREHPDAFTSSHDEEAAKPMQWTQERLRNDEVYGAFVDGVLSGMAGLARETRAKNRHKAMVFGMYVAPEFGGRGVGKALLAHVVDAARANDGVLQLILTVTDTNVAARTLYEKVGFRSFGVEPRAIFVDGTYFPKNHMILFLGSP